MCTAVTYKGKDHYFGRNLDLEYSNHEALIITPRNFPLIFRCERPMMRHYAMIGMGITEDNYPLYYDATNEFGLSMAGLNFPGNAVYKKAVPGMYNVTPFEFIPWILGQCKTVAEANSLISKLNLVDIAFSKEYPLSPLHWIIADGYCALTVEAVADGIKIYDNPIGVLTNNPPFEYHLQNLSNYVNLTQDVPTNRFAPQISITPYSRGVGAFGLPGDLSSSSRFIKAAFTKLNSVTCKTEDSSLCQFFHILGSVAQQEGCVRVGDTFEKTIYSSCCNMDAGIYYYTTYENSQITGINMHAENLDSDRIISYPMRKKLQIRMENASTIAK